MKENIVKAKLSGNELDVQNLLETLRETNNVTETSGYRESDILGEVFIYVVISRVVEE